MPSYFYAVRKGVDTGIYTSWDEAKSLVSGFTGAEYKKFRTLKDANAFMGMMTSKPPNIDWDRKESLVVFTDGSSVGNGSSSSITHYAVVWPFHSYLNERHPLPLGFTNNQAEYLACIHALEQANTVDPSCEKEVCIFTDSMLLVNSMTKWIKNWKKNGWNEGKVMNRELLERLDQLCSMRRVEWHHVRAHTGKNDWRSYWNDKADKLAHEGIMP